MTIHINEIMIIPNAEGHLMTTNKNGLANHWKKWDSHRKILTFLRVYGQSTLSVTRGSLWFESQVGIKLNLIIRGTVSGSPDKARRISINRYGASSIIYRKQFSRIFTLLVCTRSIVRIYLSVQIMFIEIIYLHLIGGIGIH